MLPNQTRETLIANLQRYRKEAEANRNFAKARDGGWREQGKPYFRHYPPEVQTVCWEFYNSLYAKYSYKLKDDPSYVRILVATATRLALEKLGLLDTRRGFHRIRHINWILQQLGIRDKREDQVANNKAKLRRKRAKAAANPPCGISQGSLEGI